MKLLWVGDPHAEPNDLADCQKLVDYILWLGKDMGHDALVLAGDLYHTHAIIHAEVQYFWREAFRAFTRAFPRVIVLKGNHDAPGSENSRATALVAHEGGGAAIVAWEPEIFYNCLFVPYATAAQVAKWSEQFQAVAPDTIFCHQDFYGATYDNGTMAGDGMNPNLIKQKQIVSGHVHKPQEFGKVWYPGAPRWRTLSDASSESRALWTLGIEDGRIVSRDSHATGAVCRRIIHLVDTETTPLHIKPNPAHEYRIDIHGSQAWIEKRRPEFEGWAIIRTVRTDPRIAVRVKESEGLSTAFGKYAAVWKAPHGTPTDKLVSMARERVSLL